MTEFVLTTHPGLENLAVEELTARRGQAPTGVQTEPGRARLELPDDERPTLLSLRSIHHVTVGLLRRRLTAPVTLDQIERAVADVEVPGLRTAPSFRVRSVRRGHHTFKSGDIERTAGAVFHIETAVKVDLQRPVITVRVDIDGDVLWVGVLLTDRPLSRRAKVYAQRVGLSADLAFAATHVADLQAPTRILDPFCGSGTLLLEAGVVHPRCELWGSDWVPGAVAGARSNLDAAGFTARSFLREQDALHMADVYPPSSFDSIVSNPPFGVKMGARINFFRFYQRFLSQADQLLKPGGRVALWVHRRGQLASAVAAHGRFEAYRWVTVQTGSARPVLVGLRRR